MDSLKVIAHIHTDLPEKFGIPRQSGLVPELKGTIVFEKEFSLEAAVKGIEEYTHLWLLWKFEGVDRETFSPTVRPPRLGGNETKGVFATRSPFRPNPIGLSSVKLDSVEYTKDGPVLHVSGIDMRDNTPIYDIKPYLAYADSHPEASNGFAGEHLSEALKVEFDSELLCKLPIQHQDIVIKLLSEDPRPHYQDDPSRTYGMLYNGFNIRFKVNDGTLTVTHVEKADNHGN